MQRLGSVYECLGSSEKHMAAKHHDVNLLRTMSPTSAHIAM
jgi:hypothetical protein